MAKIKIRTIEASEYTRALTGHLKILNQLLGNERQLNVEGLGSVSRRHHGGPLTVRLDTTPPREEALKNIEEGADPGRSETSIE